MHRIVTARTEEGNAFSEYRPPEAGIPPNFITFAVQVRSVAAGRGRERKVRATQSATQANDLTAVRLWQRNRKRPPAGDFRNSGG